MKCHQLIGYSLIACVFSASPAAAQVTEVVVGVTPTCPYGMSACWGGAHEGLSHLEGVESVALTPDVYNCTAHVYLKDGEFPKFESWPGQFKSTVGEIHVFRGIEVTIRGSVGGDEGNLVLRAPGVEHPLTLAPLEHKLQWNFKKRSARQPEPDERDAYQQLAVKTKESNGNRFAIQVTGPLRTVDKKLVLEVREFFSAAPAP